MTDRYRIPRGTVARQRLAIQTIYTWSHRRLQARQHAILKQMWALNDALQATDAREYQQEKIATQRRHWHAERRAKRDGRPWPIFDECREGEHDECIPLHMADGGVFTHCACACHTRYIASSRMCWCSEARLRDSMRPWCRWLPVGVLQWVHENFWNGHCTPRWQAERKAG